MTNRADNKKPESTLNLCDFVEKNKTRAVNWFKTRNITPEAFADVKINKKAGIPAADAAMVAFYLYACQLKKEPGYHAATYKTDSVQVDFSQEADGLFGLLNKRSLIAVIKKNPPYITFDFDGCTFDANLAGKDVIGKYKTWDEIRVWDNHNLELLLPYARIADSNQIADLISSIGVLMYKWTTKGKVAAIVIRSALLLSDTEEAVDYMEKCGMLEQYAKIRGTTVDELHSKRNKTDIGSDGSMSFEL